ncbi:IFIT5 [Branchiostoma lanceolatum]|uniref:IFIT5 protein n=1 Tax=Branchiostoma lanceolatum TaxID=7740 RepID=A0A8J9ZFQ0_BRALA|nr:IFIT5 [Branchiostoma lanceolatum]
MQKQNAAAMESDRLRKLQEFPSPFFWSLEESMFNIVHEKLIRWKCTEADRLACKNTSAFLSYARDNDSLQARRQFQEVLCEDPENLVALTSLAYIDIKHSDVATAETKQRALAELKESGGETEVQKRWATAMFEKAFCLTRFGQKRHREALGCIEKALQFDSDNNEWLKAETFLLTKQVESQALARVGYGKIKTFLDRAAANVLKLQQMEPGSGEVLCMTAYLFKAAGSTGQGLDWMKAYSRTHPSQIVNVSALYEMAYELCPTDKSVYRKVVLHFRGARNWIKMEKIAKKALEDSPNDPLLYHQLGLRYLLPFQDALMKEKTAPGKAKKASIAKVKETSKSMYKAEEYFEKGLSLEDDFTRCRMGLAWCLFYQGKVPESRQQLRIAAEKAKDKREQGEVRRELARLLIEEGNESVALMQVCKTPQFEGQAAKSSPDKTCLQDEGDPGPVREGATFAREAEFDDKPIGWNKQALEINNDIACVTEKGKAAKHRSPDQSPTAPFDEACGPVDQSICRNAVLHFKEAREWQKMEQILTKALKHFPNDQFLYHQYGLRYLVPFELALADEKETKGKVKQVTETCRAAKTLLPKAEEYLREALKIDHLFTRCRTCLARCLYYQGKVQESRQQFQITTEDAIDNHDIVEVRRNWAWLQIEDGDESGALIQLCEALKLKDRGVSAVYQGLDTALDSWSKLDKRDPRPVRVRAAFALETGREDKAIRYYNRALQINNKDNSSMVGVGKAYKKKGNFTEAKKWLERASRLGSDEANDQLTDLRKVEDQSGTTGPSPQIVGHGTSASPRTYEDDTRDTEGENLQGATAGHSAPQPDQSDCY